MAKLTKAQRRDAESALSCLNRAMRFLESDRVALCFSGTINSACSHGTEYRASPAKIDRKHYTGKDGEEWDIDFIATLEPFSKGVGSDFVALYDARKAIERLLSPEAGK